MRKTDPAGVLESFEEQLEEQSEFYDEVWDAFSDQTHRKMAAENYAIAIGVMFEGFINDLILAYANRDCSRLMQHLRNSVDEALKPSRKAVATFRLFGEIRPRRNLNMDELRTLLDPEGRNTSFPNYDAIEVRAKQWLVPQHFNLFQQVSAQDRAIVDLVIAVRNNIAHRSKSSLDRLNATVAAGSLHGTGLERQGNGVQQVGVYLKTAAGVNETRADILGRRLGNVATSLIA